MLRAAVSTCSKMRMYIPCLHQCCHNNALLISITTVAAPPIVRPVVIERSPLEVIVAPSVQTYVAPPPVSLGYSVGVSVATPPPLVVQAPALPSLSFGLSIGTPTAVVRPPSVSVVSAPVGIVEVRRSPSPCRKVIYK